MQYSTLLLAAFASLASAQNPFTFSSLPQSISVGTPFNITWAPTTGNVDTVTILLRQGDPNHLATAATIAPSIQNTGSFLWTPTDAIVNGDKYAFEIVDDKNPNIVNYSGQFAISSPNTVSSAAPSSVTSVGSSAASQLTSSATAAASTSASSSTTGSSTESSTESSASTSTSGSAATSSGSKTSTKGSATSTGSASATTTTSAPTGNAAVELKVSGGLLVVVGAIMAAL